MYIKLDINSLCQTNFMFITIVNSMSYRIFWYVYDLFPFRVSHWLISYCLNTEAKYTMYFMSVLKGSDSSI
jgi:hypothetical protein